MYRIGFYGLILAVTLLGALGLDAGDDGSKRAADARFAVVAAPVAAGGDNGDNGDNGGAPGTGTPTRTGTPATSTPTATRTPTGSRDNTDNSGFDNFDNLEFDSEDNGFDNEDNFGVSSLDDLYDNFGVFATITPFSIPTPIGTPVLPPSAQVQPSTPAPVAGGRCQFVLGFAYLHWALNGRDGACLTDEFSDPSGTGDMLQLTSLPVPNGLMVWNKATNSMRWTDGNKTWAYSKCLLQERLNTEVFAWELNPNLLIPESAPLPPGACDILPRTAGSEITPGS
jgi:hypothetical protein